MKYPIALALSLIMYSASWGTEEASSQRPKFIALYRGIHFFENLFSAEERYRAVERCFESRDIGQPLFSSAAGTLVGSRYLTANPQEEKALFQSGQLLHDVLLEIKANHESEYNIFHQTFTNNHYRFHTLLGDSTYINKKGASNNLTLEEKAAFEVYKRIFSREVKNPSRELNRVNEEGIWRNCFLAFSQGPKHALKYALGQKYMIGTFLKPEYDKKGAPKNKYLGKVYIALIQEEDFKAENPTSVLDLHAQGKIKIQSTIQDILVEAEVSFLGYLKGKYIAYSHAVKVPAFNKPYKKTYQKKFGLDKNKFVEFKGYGCNLNKIEIFKELLLKNHVIPAYCNKLERIARDRVRKIGGELTFVGFGQHLGEVLPSEVSDILHNLYRNKAAVIKPGKAMGLGNQESMTPDKLVNRTKLVVENIPHSQASVFTIKDYPFEEEAGSIFKNLFLTSPMLKELFLENLGLTPQAIFQIAEGLKANTSLIKLSLQSNPLETEGCTALAGALEHNKYLKRLDIRETGIDERGLKCFLALLSMSTGKQKNKTLTELLFSEAGISSRTQKAIDNGLRRNILKSNSQPVEPPSLTAEASYKLGEAYLRGQGLSSSFDEGMKYLIFAASLGHPEASVQTACFLLDNYSNSQLITLAKGWILGYFKTFRRDESLEGLIAHFLKTGDAQSEPGQLFSNGVELFYETEDMDIEIMGKRASHLSVHEGDLGDRIPRDDLKDMLRVIVNTLSDFTLIELLIDRYQLNQGHPFATYQNFALLKEFLNIREIIDEKAARGDMEAIKRKMDGLTKGIYGYEEDLAAAVDFINALVNQGNQWAIEMKLKGLTFGMYGYEEDLAAAVAFNDKLVKQGNQWAVERKMEGLTKGMYGYEKDFKAARKLNCYLIKQGNQWAIKRKMDGLIEGKYGYKKDPATAVGLNDSLIEQGNEWAIERKSEGLTFGKYGYKKDAAAAVAFNDKLVKQGNEWAIERKSEGLTFFDRFGYERGSESEAIYDAIYIYFLIEKGEEYYWWPEWQRHPQSKRSAKRAYVLNEHLIEPGKEWAIGRKLKGLTKGMYGYKKDPAAARDFNDSLIDQGNERAIYRKLCRLAKGRYFYKKEAPAAVAFNDKLVKQGNQRAIDRKLWGLAEGKYGYEKDLAAAVAFNDKLVKQGNQRAMERKLLGLAEGKYGYEKDLAAAVAFNDKLVKQGNERAMDRKLLGLAEGKYGYEEDAAAAVAFNDSLIEQGNDQAIKRKIAGIFKRQEFFHTFLRGEGHEVGELFVRYYTDKICLSNFHSGEQLFRRWVEEEEKKGSPWAYYIKAQGLKYGIFSFAKNRDEAIRYIQKYRVPY